MLSISIDCDCVLITQLLIYPDDIRRYRTAGMGLRLTGGDRGQDTKSSLRLEGGTDTDNGLNAGHSTVTVTLLMNGIRFSAN